MYFILAIKAHVLANLARILIFRRLNLVRNLYENIIFFCFLLFGTDLNFAKFYGNCIFI